MSLKGLTAISVLISVAILCFGEPYSRAPQPPLALPDTASAPAIVTPAKYRRAPANTYLTFPEWFLVFSPKEYAHYTETRTPTGFPFLGHIAQFWFGYWEATKATRPYPFDFDYHLMDVIIGVSTSGEYLVKAGYEETVGRLTGHTVTTGMTAEDRFGHMVAADYAAFIEVHAWYEYNFFARLGQLWSDTGTMGPDMMRKWERKYFLTTEYLFKGVYGYLMNWATRSSYDPESPVTAVLADHFDKLGPDYPDVEVLQHFDNGTTLLTVPRYQAFGRYACEMARLGVNFKEIAGNGGDIMVTYLVPAGERPDAPLMFWQSILTSPDLERVVLKVPIPRLADLLRTHPIPEHVFDY